MQTPVPTPARAPSVLPSQGETTATPTTISNAPLKLRFKLPSQPEIDYHGPNARAAHLASESALLMAITPTSDEPKSIAEAMRRPDASKWSEAIAAELQNLVCKGTWEETSLKGDERRSAANGYSRTALSRTKGVYFLQEISCRCRIYEGHGSCSRTPS